MRVLDFVNYNYNGDYLIEILIYESDWRLDDLFCKVRLAFKLDPIPFINKYIKLFRVEVDSYITTI